jgi:hypothetical protein
MKLWKVLGLAGLAGVAATGVIIAREQRQRAQLTPEEIRARLQERVEQAAATSGGAPETAQVAPAASAPRRGCRPRWRGQRTIRGGGRGTD